MKVDDLLNRVGVRLNEDFTYSPLWPKSVLIEYLKTTIADFCALTKLVDRHSVRICTTASNATAFLVPDDFNSAFHVLYNQKHVDLVRFNDMDFVGDGWTADVESAVPYACTQLGIGARSVMSLSPPVSSVAGAFGSGILSEVFLESPDGTLWEVYIMGGALVTAVSVSGTASTVTLPGPTTLWLLTVSNLGILSTAVSVDSATTIYLEDDDGSDYIWFVQTDDLGVLDPRNMCFGTVASVQLDSTYQEVLVGDNSEVVHAGDADNEEYGVIVDAYATGVSTTPDSVCLVDEPVGVDNIDRNMDNTATVYYIGSIKEPVNVESTIFIHDAFVPVVEHGVLALAYGADTSGRDADKAKLLRAIFEAECTSLQGMFGRK